MNYLSRVLSLSAVMILISCTDIVAQFPFQLINNQHGHNLGSAYLPSLLGDDMKTAEVQLIGLTAGFGNNFISAENLQTLSNEGNLSSSFIDNLLKKSPEQCRLWAGVDVPLMNIFFAIRKKKKPFLSFGIGSRQKLDADISLNKNLLSLLYKGNKQFAAQTVNLSPAMNMMLYNEFFVTAAAQFTLPKIGRLKGIGIKPALRIRQLNGIAAIAMPTANIDMYTDPEGRFIQLNTNLQANLASSVDTPDVEGVYDDIDFLNLKQAGRGIGMDLGLGIQVNERLSLHAGLTDIGEIRFKRNVINYTAQSSYRYEGVDLNNTNETISTATLDSLLQPVKTYQNFTMSLPTKLVFSGAYQMKKKTRKRVSYYQHNLYLTYVQGFRNYLSSSKTPLVNVGYAYNLFNKLNVGVHITGGGLSGLMGGGHLGVRLGSVKFGFASNNLLPLVVNRAGRGTDASMYFGFYF
jgi:hypothetical protein